MTRLTLLFKNTVINLAGLVGVLVAFGLTKINVCHSMREGLQCPVLPGGFLFLQSGNN